MPKLMPVVCLVGLLVVGVALLSLRYCLVGNRDEADVFWAACEQCVFSGDEEDDLLRCLGFEEAWARSLNESGWLEDQAALCVGNSVKEATLDLWALWVPAMPHVVAAKRRAITLGGVRFAKRIEARPVIGETSVITFSSYPGRGPLAFRIDRATDSDAYDYLAAIHTILSRLRPSSTGMESVRIGK